MSVPYHMHNFAIPVATKEDVQQGIRDDLAVVPSSLGSAALANHSDFATAEQGAKAESAVQNRSLGKLAAKDKIAITDIDTTGIASTRTYLNGMGQWTIPKQTPYKLHISTGLELQAKSISDHEVRLTVSQNLIEKIEKFDLKSKQYDELKSQIKASETCGLTANYLDGNKISLSINQEVIKKIIEDYIDTILVGTIHLLHGGGTHGDPDISNRNLITSESAIVFQINEYPLFKEYLSHWNPSIANGAWNIFKTRVTYSWEFQYQKRWMYVGKHVAKHEE